MKKTEMETAGVLSRLLQSPNSPELCSHGRAAGEGFHLLLCMTHPSWVYLGHEDPDSLALHINIALKNHLQKQSRFFCCHVTCLKNDVKVSAVETDFQQT